jgi:hypothetical protein
VHQVTNRMRVRRFRAFAKRSVRAARPARWTAPHIVSLWYHLLSSMAALGAPGPNSSDQDEDAVKQLSDDPQLLALHRVFTNSRFVEACAQHKIVWAQVKGHPWWPVRYCSLAGGELPSAVRI